MQDLRRLLVNPKWQRWISETRIRYWICTVVTWNWGLLHFIEHQEHRVGIRRKHGFTKNSASKIRVISFTMCYQNGSWCCDTCDLLGFQWFMYNNTRSSTDPFRKWVVTSTTYWISCPRKGLLYSGYQWFRGMLTLMMMWSLEILIYEVVEWVRMFSLKKRILVE